MITFMKQKIRKKMNELYLKLFNKLNEVQEKVNEVQEDVQTTRFTKRIPKLIATVCSTALVGVMSPMTVFAAGTSTDSIDKFVTEIGKWLVKIGVVVAMVGGVMFALGWQREDSEGKSRGLLTIMAGFMVAAIGASPAAFGFSS